MTQNGTKWMVLAALVCGGFLLGADGIAAEPAADRQISFHPLFNGKNLDGWYLFLQKHGRDNDPEKVVTVENGEIHAYKDAKNGAEVVMGYIGTNDSFSDYHLRLKYKWGNK